MSSSSWLGSPTDWPRSSNNSPPATLTGTCIHISWIYTIDLMHSAYQHRLC
jgi:hypothetical protein